MIKEFTINMPTADDSFGRWLEANNVRISFCVMFGQYDITVSWRKVHRYSDDRGEHVEEWSVSRRNPDFKKAMAQAIEVAQNEMTIHAAKWAT